MLGKVAACLWYKIFFFPNKEIIPCESSFPCLERKGHPKVTMFTPFLLDFPRIKVICVLHRLNNRINESFQRPSYLVGGRILDGILSILKGEGGLTFINRHMPYESDVQLDDAALGM